MLKRLCIPVLLLALCFNLTAAAQVITEKSLNDKLAPINEDLRQIQDEIRRLQRDNIDLQKLLIESGVTASLREDMKRLQESNEASQKAIQNFSGGAPVAAAPSKDLESLKNDLKTLQAQNAKLTEAVRDLGGKITAPPVVAPVDPATPAAPAAPAAPADFETKLKELDDAHSLSINMMWTLVTGFLVMFMQAGFALVETGFTRAKNCAHTMSMNFMVYALGMFGYWVCGFGLQFGGTGAATSVSAVGTLGPVVPQVLNSEFGIELGGKFFGLFGTTGFFLPPSMLDGGVFTLFLFQMVFMDTTATVPTGAMAERWKFGAFVAFALLVGSVIYPIYGNWVWGGGWLAALGKNFGLGHGHVDFAGSSVVHLQGGVLALVGSYILGARQGKYNKDGSPNAIPGHNIPMAMLGTFILAFGWFGFNPGSTLSGRDGQIGIIAVNTMLAGTTGCMAAMFIMKIRTDKWDPSFMCNGLLAGLVAITAPCAFVESWAACAIGAIAGVIVVFAAFFVEETLRIDDPVGAIAVHGFNGAWGCLSIGIFANGRYGDGWNSVSGKVTGLMYGDYSQIIAQSIGVIVCTVFVGALGFVVFKLTDITIGMRANPIDEVKGLDIPEMGALGYQSDLNPTSK